MKTIIQILCKTNTNFETLNQIVIKYDKTGGFNKEHNVKHDVIDNMYDKKSQK